MKAYTTVQAAKKLGIARDTIYRWMREKKVRGAGISRVGDLELRLWNHEDLAHIRAYMKRHPHENRGRKRESKARKT